MLLVKLPKMIADIWASKEPGTRLGSLRGAGLSGGDMRFTCDPVTLGMTGASASMPMPLQYDVRGTRVAKVSKGVVVVVVWGWGGARDMRCWTVVAVARVCAHTRALGGRTPGVSCGVRICALTRAAHGFVARRWSHI